MPTVKGIISRGYLPKELPPAFTSEICGNVLSINRSSLPNDFNNDRLSKNVIHNLLIRVNSRRRLGIPNPTNFFRLACFVENNWISLINIANQSTISRTTPISLRPPNRALSPRIHSRLRAEQKTLIRSKSRYILTADINRFYHSIYTHSISWAIHGKAIAKAKRKSSQLPGNRLDKLIRNSQDGQTIGVPIGPDTSLLVAEIILSRIDSNLVRRGFGNALRFIDDYEFGCDSLVQAEDTRAYIQELLFEYELNLNMDKSNIIELPIPIESMCISQLRAYELNTPSAFIQENKLIHYFGLAFSLLRECPTESVLKYAINRLRGIIVFSANWSIYENLLMQVSVVDPSTIGPILNQIVRYRDMGYKINLHLVGEVFHSIIEKHAQLGHSSYVAWAIWTLIVLNIPIQDSSASKALYMKDSVVVILVLDARAKGLISKNVDFSSIQSYMTTDDLYEEQWLLAYEANVKKWLQSTTAIDHVKKDKCFHFLKRNGVYFYDDTLSRKIKYKPYEPPADEEY